MAEVLKGLNIAVVGPIPPPAGGMANQTRKLTEFLRSEGAECQVVPTNAPYKPAWAEKIKGFRALFRLFPYLAHLNRACKEADVMHIMANSGWSWHLFAAPAIAIARLNNTPVVLNYRGGYAEAFFQSSWFWVNLTLKKVQKIVVPSPFLQGVFAKWNKSAEVIPNVLDTERFHFSPKSSVADNPNILVARNLEDIYDVGSAVKAFNIICQTFPDANLYVAGTGPQKAELEALVSELELTDKVVFTGRLSPDEMARHYHLADLSINPSKVDNTPNSVIESLACGTPVVSTNVGGIPALVTDGHDAFLVPPQQPDALAKQALVVLSDEICRQNMVQNGFQTIQKFTWPNVRDLLVECYGEAMNSNSES